MMTLKTVRRTAGVAVLVVTALAAGACQRGSNADSKGGNAPQVTGDRATAPATGDAALAGRWRILSERLFYDAGGAGAGSEDATRRLELSAGGGWSFGSSSGRWSVAAIDASDWGRWGVEAYGPTRKIVLDGWSGGQADGPVEESGGAVDALWIIYRARTGPAGTVQMKLGHG